MLRGFCMPQWLILPLKWGGLSLVVSCGAALLLTAFLSHGEGLAAMKLFTLGMALGFACALAGFRWQRQQEGSTENRTPQPTTTVPARTLKSLLPVSLTTDVELSTARLDRIAIDRRSRSGMT